MGRSRWVIGAIAGCWLPATALAEDGSEPGPTSVELESWLEADIGAGDREVEPSDAAEEELPPLPAPRERGLVIETSAGALGHVGDMQHVSPVSPWFRLQVGYEVLDWLLVLVQTDIALSSTAFAQRPPEKRSYALIGGGAAARFGWQPFTALGLYMQMEGGLAGVTEDVLSTYGYRDADGINPYFGGTVGIDWFQVSPHYALSVFGGGRHYTASFERAGGERAPLAWVSGLAIRYAP